MVVGADECSVPARLRIYNEFRILGQKLEHFVTRFVAFFLELERFKWKFHSDCQRSWKQAFS